MNIENSFFYHYIIIISNSTHHCQPHPISWRAIRKYWYKTKCANIRCTYVPLHTWCQNSFLLTINWKINIIKSHFFGKLRYKRNLVCWSRSASMYWYTCEKREHWLKWNGFVAHVNAQSCRGRQAHIIILS